MIETNPIASQICIYEPASDNHWFISPTTYKCCKHAKWSAICCLHLYCKHTRSNVLSIRLITCRKNRKMLQYDIRSVRHIQHMVYNNWEPAPIIYSNIYDIMWWDHFHHETLLIKKHILWFHYVMHHWHINRGQWEIAIPAWCIWYMFWTNNIYILTMHV